MAPDTADRPVDGAHVAALQRAVEEDAVDALAARLDDPDADVRAGAAWHLVDAAGATPDAVTEVLPDVVDAADDPDVWVRRGVTWVLAELAESRPAAVTPEFEVLVAAARDDDPLVQQNAAVALAGVASHAPSRAAAALSTLVVLARGTDALVERYARDAIRDVLEALAARRAGGYPVVVYADPVDADLFPGDGSVVVANASDDRERRVHVAANDDGPQPKPESNDPGARGPPDDVPDLADVRLGRDDLSPGRERGRDVLTTHLRATVDDGAFHHGVVRFRRLRVGERTVSDAFADAVAAWAAVDDHDHVESVLGHDDHWVATRGADAGTLADRGAPATLAEAVWTAGALTRAVSYAHNRGVVHGGLHPGVVRYVDAGPDVWHAPVVTDWGFAHAASALETPPIPGAFAAPEHRDPATYGRFDQATDVYGLGAVTHLLLTGLPPHATADDVPATDLNPALPEAADSLFARALAPEKQARFATVLDFQRALDELAASLDGGASA